MFHGNLVHGSAGNITPFSRKIVYLTLNAVSNYIRKPTRPEWIAHQDFRPIEPCDPAGTAIPSDWPKNRTLGSGPAPAGMIRVRQLAPASMLTMSTAAAG